MAARVFVPAGGALPWGADDLGLADRIAEDVDGWPPHVRWRVRGMLDALELLPLRLGRRRTLSRLGPQEAHEALKAAYHHRSAPVRMLAGFAKQLCYTFYLSAPEVEEAVGYTYACLKPRDGVGPGEQVHR